MMCLAKYHEKKNNGAYMGSLPNHSDPHKHLIDDQLPRYQNPQVAMQGSPETSGSRDLGH